MTAEENKAIVLHGFEVAAQGGLEAVFALFDATFDPACSFPDLAFYGLPPTLESYKQFLSSVNAAFSFSERSVTLEKVVAEGDTVMAWLTQQVTHTGPWRNIPATNKRVSYRLTECYRLAQGKVIEFRFLPDSLSLLQQIGAIPSSG